VHFLNSSSARKKEGGSVFKRKQVIRKEKRQGKVSLANRGEKKRGADRVERKKKLLRKGKKNASMGREGPFRRPRGPKPEGKRDPR